MLQLSPFPATFHPSSHIPASVAASLWLPAELGFKYYDPANIGVSTEVMSSPTFWLSILVCYIITFGMRFVERTYVWAFKPHDTFILSEKVRPAVVRATEATAGLDGLLHAAAAAFLRLQGGQKAGWKGLVSSRVLTKVADAMACSACFLLSFVVQERKDGLMHNLSAPTRKRLAELGTVRQRASGRASAGADLERGSEDGLSGELPPLRAQYGGSMTSQQQQHSPSAMDGLEQHNSGGSQLGELEMSGGSFGRQLWAAAARRRAGHPRRLHA